ncbi:NADPH-dependent FMN reductase [Geomicrobium sediminis]|uniref:FMN reductase n=1 Tax=Geomicrobium sediminis TaxID=1347788 RepID=A0ABS2PBZ4_9BACL|nr:NADPH-dependent FMN reductase [Geomicrobium sediminis]MBM7632943.1 FMN reductase [Geomicrobium sediminis]
MNHVVVISGSPSEPSKTSHVLHEVAGRLKADCSVDFINVRDLPAEDLLHAKFGSPSIKEASALVERAEVIIIGSPIYKASITGGLKAFLDLLPEGALRGKTVLPLATGGSIAHYLSLDFSLLPVLHTLGSTHLLKPVYVLSSDIHIDDDHLFIQDVDTAARVDQAVEQILQGFQSYEKVN